MRWPAAHILQIRCFLHRLGIILTLFVPALGWVGFNILSGLNAQLALMDERAVGPEARSLKLKRSVAGAVGLGAAALLASAQSAEASEVMQLAASDNRQVAHDMLGQKSS